MSDDVFKVNIPQLPWGPAPISFASIGLDLEGRNEEGEAVPLKMLQCAFTMPDGTVHGMVLNMEACELIAKRLMAAAQEARTGLTIMENGSKLVIPTERRMKDAPQA